MIDWNKMLWQGMWQALLVLPKFWQLGLMVAIVYGAKFAIYYFEQRRLSASGIAEIDGMDGRTFEKYLENLFNRLGYRVERTRYVGDYGADLVTRKDGVRTVIQAKRYKGKVGIKAIQEAVASKGYYDCAAAMVVTNSTYTKQAVELAQANGVVLWDRDRLVEALLSAHTSNSTDPAVAAATPVMPVCTPTISRPVAAPAEARCGYCGTTVSDKVRDFCRSHPERFKGEVFCYEHQRASRRSAVPVGESQT